MWDGFERNGADFGIDDLAQDTDTAATATRERLEREAETFGLWNPRLAAAETGFGETENDEMLRELLGDDPEGDDILAELLKNAALLHDEPEINGHPLDQPENAENSSTRCWLPYESKVIFLLDLIDNLPRLRISSSLMRVLLWVLKEMGVRDVPSLDRLRKVQKWLRGSSGVASLDCVSVRGNRFTINDPVELVAKDYANPLTVPHLERYIVDPCGKISEVYHAQKWHHDVPSHILSPMYNDRQRNQHFYVNELACDLRADAYRVSISFDGIASVHDQDSTESIKACDLAENYLSLEESQKLPSRWSNSVDAEYPAKMPNPLRDIAKGRPLYTSFIDYFSDDVSGNRSKSWNKHWNAYMTHRNLPRRLLQQEFHTHFVSTSQHASIAEQFFEAKKRAQAVPALARAHGPQASMRGGVF
ncbi:uncharacterized protein B0H18DRAFT_956856 [Fomitopsis serialis]|uniref:uncharacterized protein n=1 Tax=Fomitopsis serialis TaxID=139415 RepID=UPI002008A51A|nr:uncharacterized protein B0H18DRAFT_956856 [Neoantrodia serialis]KAH9920949.1 hypothetical protein B0H18DRAFT_956856 [Neoantrodia serialis]